MTEAKWINYGDVNPMEHGGRWVLKDDESRNAFYVVVWTPYNSGEGGILADGYVDPTDTWMNRSAVADWADWHEDTTPEQRALDYFEYYGAENFGGSEQTMSLAEATAYLKDREIFEEE